MRDGDSIADEGSGSGLRGCRVKVGSQTVKAKRAMMADWVTMPKLSMSMRMRSGLRKQDERSRGSLYHHHRRCGSSSGNGPWVEVISIGVGPC